jgi:hypothetical protein
VFIFFIVNYKQEMLDTEKKILYGVNSDVNYDNANDTRIS